MGLISMGKSVITNYFNDDLQNGDCVLSVSFKIISIRQNYSLLSIWKVSSRMVFAFQLFFFFFL